MKQTANNCPNVWDTLDIILVNNKEEFNLFNITITILDNISPKELIINGVPKIDPFNKLPRVNLKRTIIHISLKPFCFKVINEIIFARPNLIPKYNGGKKTFSTKFITIANAQYIANLAYL